MVILPPIRPVDSMPVFVACPADLPISQLCGSVAIQDGVLLTAKCFPFCWYRRPVRRTSAMKAKISNRLPLHMSMTKAVRQRFAVLDQQYTNTTSLQKLQQLDDSNDSHKSKGVAAPGSPVLGTTVQADFYKSGSHRPVLPQMLTVSLQGSVLLKDQIKSGSYICETQQSSARKLLEGMPQLCRTFHICWCFSHGPDCNRLDLLLASNKVTRQTLRLKWRQYQCVHCSYNTDSNSV